MDLEEKNTIYLFAHLRNLFLSRLSFVLSGILFWAVAARLYTVEEVGVGSALVSVVSLIVFVSSLGIAPTFVRFLPQGENKSKLLGTFLSFSLFLSVLCCGVFLIKLDIFMPELNFLKTSFYPLVFIFFTFAMLLFQVLGGIFISFKATKLVFIKTLNQNFLRIALLFGFTYWGVWEYFLQTVWWLH